MASSKAANGEQYSAVIPGGDHRQTGAVPGQANTSPPVRGPCEAKTGATSALKRSRVRSEEG